MKEFERYHSLRERRGEEGDGEEGGKDDRRATLFRIVKNRHWKTLTAPTQRALFVLSEFP